MFVLRIKFFTDTAHFHIKMKYSGIYSLKSISSWLRKNNAGVHAFCWSVFIAYELGMIYAVIGKLDRPYIYLIYYPINISYFYLIVSLLKYTFNSGTNKIAKGITGFLIIFAGYLFIKGIADLLLEGLLVPQQNSLVYFRDFFQRNLSRGLYFGLLALFYWSAGHIAYFRKKSLEAEKQQLKAEKQKAELETLLERSRNAYLQQQINPHMLFNALNFVYNKVQEHSEDAAQCIWLLSEITRFGLEGADEDGKVSLAREMEQIDNLISINRYRFKEPLGLRSDITAPQDGLRIIPLILLTLTENIFKHGDLTDPDRPALLQITTDANGRLLFFSRNLKKSKNVHRRKQELGLQNVRIRLNLAYGNRYALTTADLGDIFELTLTLDL